MRRTWEIGPYYDDSGNPYPPSDEEVQGQLLAIQPQLENLGGYIIVAPKRVKFPDGSFGTLGWILKYDSSMPAADAPKGTRGEDPEPLAHEEPEPALPEPPAEPEPQPEPALAE